MRSTKFALLFLLCLFLIVLAVPSMSQAGILEVKMGVSGMV